MLVSSANTVIPRHLRLTWLFEYIRQISQFYSRRISNPEILIVVLTDRTSSCFVFDLCNLNVGRVARFFPLVFPLVWSFYPLMTKRTFSAAHKIRLILFTQDTSTLALYSYFVIARGNVVGSSISALLTMMLVGQTFGISSKN